MRETREITWDDLESLSIGTNILGTGGGGDSYMALLNARKLHRQGFRYRLIDPATLGDHDLVAEVSFMGAPLVSKERLSDPEICARPARAMESHLGRPFTAVMSGEIGGANGVIPLLAAAAMNLPIVDADTMGRAFPEMQMSSFVIRGVPLCPFTMSDIRGNEVLITNAADSHWVERMSRVVCTEMGSTASTCCAPRGADYVKHHAILGTVTQAIELGRAVRRARAENSDPVAAVLATEDGVSLFEGKVADVARRTTAGFLKGTVELDGLDDFAGSRFRVAFQNEWLLGWRDGALQVMVPDLICILDSVSGASLGTESIRYGQRVTVVSLPPPDVLTGADGLKVVGPRAFGYDMDYVPLHRRETA